MRNMKISVVKFLSLIVAMLMLGSFSTFAQVSVTFPQVVGTSGQTAKGNVTVGDLTGKNVTAFSFTITYDKSVAYILGVDSEGTKTASNPPTVNADTANGKISVAWASATALSGSGTLLKLNIQFRGFGNTDLNLNNTFLFNAGNPAAVVTNGNILTAAILLTVDNVTTISGSDILIPIKTSVLTSAQNVLSYDYTLAYDATAISITGYELAGTLSENGSASINTNVAGTVKFAWARDTKIAAEGTLMYLKGKALKAGTSAVSLTAFKFNSGNPTALTVAGTVTASEKNVAPVVTLNPALQIYGVNEGQTITLKVEATDANAGDVVTFSTKSPLPAGATLNATTGAFSWTPSYDQGTTFYSIGFLATDKGGLASKVVSATFIVNNVNRAPYFTSVPADEVVVPVHNVPFYYTFPWTAKDDDGDNVVFSLVVAPTGASISTSGLFSWSPTVQQAGQAYVVTVQITDGTFTDTKQVIVRAADKILDIENEAIPSVYALAQNYPNPFNPTTSIKFALPKESNVKLSVYTILGEEIALLVNRVMPAGNHQVEFNASKLNSGMYIYKIEANNFVSVKKMILIK
jgi:hypothetical protein